MIAVRNRFRRPRARRYTAHETDAHDAEEDPNSEEEESCEEESDLTTAFKREMDELASVEEELEDTLGVRDVEDLREFSESMYEELATVKETHAKLREKTRNSHAAFGSRHASLSHWPWKRQDETYKRVCTSKETCSTLL